MTNADRMKVECKRLGDHAADLQRDLNAAKARIAELEAECFKLARMVDPVLPKDSLQR